MCWRFRSSLWVSSLTVFLSDSDGGRKTWVYCRGLTRNLTIAIAAPLVQMAFGHLPRRRLILVDASLMAARAVASTLEPAEVSTRLSPRGNASAQSRNRRSERRSPLIFEREVKTNGRFRE